MYCIVRLDTRPRTRLDVDVWNGTIPEVQSFISVTGVTFPVLRLGGYLQIDYPDGYGLHNDNYLVLDQNGVVQYTSDEGPYITTRFNDALVRATIRAYVPNAVEPAAWSAIKSLYR